MRSHYLNQCGCIVNSTPRNKILWNINRNSKLFIDENVFEFIVWLGLHVHLHPVLFPHTVMDCSFFPHFTLLKPWLLNTGCRSAPHYLCVSRYSGIICFNHFANQYIMNVCTVIIECAVYAIKYEQGLVWSNCENILTGSTKVFIQSLRWCFYRHCIRHMLTPVPTTAKTSKLMIRAFLFSLICAWINGWVNNSEVSDFRRNHTHYDVIVMMCMAFLDVLYAQNERD